MTQSARALGCHCVEEAQRKAARSLVFRLRKQSIKTTHAGKPLSGLNSRRIAMFLRGYGRGYRLTLQQLTDTAGRRRALRMNIMPSAGAVTCGVAYWCSACRRWRSSRSVPGTRRRWLLSPGVWICGAENAIDVQTIAGRSIRSVARGFTVAEGRPSEWYLEIILLGAKEHGLPDDYIRAIEVLAKQAGSSGGCLMFRDGSTIQN